MSSLGLEAERVGSTTRNLAIWAMLGSQVLVKLWDEGNFQRFQVVAILADITELSKNFICLNFNFVHTCGNVAADFCAKYSVDRGQNAWKHNALGILHNCL